MPIWIIAKSTKMISNANNLPRWNVESTLQTIHMHLYPNYKHKSTIKTFLQKQNTHEINKKSKGVKIHVENQKSKLWSSLKRRCSPMIFISFQL
jgi:peptidase E